MIEAAYRLGEAVGPGVRARMVARGDDQPVRVELRLPSGQPLVFGEAGAANAGLLAAAILALSDEALAERLERFRAEQSAAVAETPV